MQKLLSTTALIVALGSPAITLAQTSDTATNTEAEGKTGSLAGFLAERGQSDLYASDLMGHDVYAYRTSKEQSSSGAQTASNSGKSSAMASMNRSALAEMDAIGQINEIILSNDGKVRALVIEVGGFLGMGEQDVAVTMDQVTFATDSEDRSEMYIVVNTGKESLQNAPAYDRTAAINPNAKDNERTGANQNSGKDAKQDHDGTGSYDREAFAAPKMEREGYDMVKAQDVSTDMLIGKTVYDLNDNGVGDVKDIIIDDDGKVTNVIIDFGGFLGIGSSQASLQYEELTILTNKGYEDVRLYVDATKQQIQDLPQYVASK